MKKVTLNGEIIYLHDEELDIKKTGVAIPREETNESNEDNVENVDTDFWGDGND